MSRTLVLYEALRTADSAYWSPFGDSARDAIRLLNALGLTQLRYLLLAILDVYPKGLNLTAAKSRKAKTDAVGWLAAWGIRGVVTGRTGVKQAETAYLEAAAAVRAGKATTVADIRKIFVAAGRTATDPEFKADFARASLNATATKVAMYALETHLLGKDAPMGPKPKLTREHVLPQNPDENSGAWKHFSAQTHADFVERLGNTLLLTGITNSSLRNKSWAEKKSLIRKKGVKQLPLTEEALLEPKWTKSVIEKRQRRMADLAIAVWRG